MYAFRKPYTAAQFKGFSLWGIDFKTVLVTAQLLGYTLSKFIGIKVVAELNPRRRALVILGLIGFAQLSLLLFGLITAPFNFFCLFLNGLPLGMVFGLVVGFLEGRRQTELLTAGLCVSFIVADGVTKSVGGWLLDPQLSFGGHHIALPPVSEFWMPFLSGLIFLMPLFGFVWMLTRIPAPSSADVAARSERVAMNRDDRWRFFWHYALGLTILLAIYLFTTVLRNIRSDFAAEIWTDLKLPGAPGKFGLSETLVGLGVLPVAAAIVLIRSNRRAFFASLVLCFGGFALLIMALIGLSAAWLQPLPFMVLYGLGLYLPYVTVQTTLFERLIAMTRDRGNLGFLITLADAFGYLGTCAVMLMRNSVKVHAGFLDYFVMLSWILGLLSLVMLIPCWRYFAVHESTRRVMKPVAAQA
jgi:hypothetical protein